MKVAGQGTLMNAMMNVMLTTMAPTTTMSNGSTASANVTSPTNHPNVTTIGPLSTTVAGVTTASSPKLETTAGNAIIPPVVPLSTTVTSGTTVSLPKIETTTGNTIVTTGAASSTTGAALSTSLVASSTTVAALSTTVAPSLITAAGVTTVGPVQSSNQTTAPPKGNLTKSSDPAAPHVLVTTLKPFAPMDPLPGTFGSNGINNLIQTNNVPPPNEASTTDKAAVTTPKAPAPTNAVVTASSPSGVRMLKPFSETKSNMFIQVENGIEYIFSCPPATVWDSRINSCNHFSLVN